MEEPYKLDEKADWRHRARCLEENPELFFPNATAFVQVEEAKKVCLQCDVRDRCLAWALETDQRYGVWGGLSEEERRTLKRRSLGRRSLI